MTTTKNNSFMEGLPSLAPKPTDTSHLVISDTHGIVDVSALVGGETADVLIHCGDFSCGHIVKTMPRYVTKSHEKSVEAFFKQIAKVRNQFDRVLVVPGNHDQMAEVMPARVKQMGLDIANANVLIDDFAIVKGRMYYGLPWTLPNNEWFFQAKPHKMAYAVDSIPSCTSVLISHGPIRGILDRINPVPGCKDFLGSDLLRQAVNRLPHIAVVVHGHIHGSGMSGAFFRTHRIEGVVAINACVLDETYKPHPRCKQGPMRFTTVGPLPPLPHDSND